MKKPKLKPMWRPPRGWFRATINARLERERREAAIEDNTRRAQYNLPTYEV